MKNYKGKHFFYVAWLCFMLATLILMLYMVSTRMSKMFMYQKSFEGFEGGGGGHIPKVLFQTSKDDRPEAYVTDMIRTKCPGWTYRHFTDADILQYFEEHPHAEFPNMTEQFHRLTGAHKADLFRYFFIYLEGGVFLDSDAMIFVDMNDIARDYDFFSVNSICVPGSIFQGFIGAVPGNDIMYKALKDAYVVDPAELKADYHLLVKHMYNFVMDNATYQFKRKLYTERPCDSSGIGQTHDDEPDSENTPPEDNGRLILKHFYTDKKIPINMGTDGTV
jgi:hypothetical protein